MKKKIIFSAVCTFVMTIGMYGCTKDKEVKPNINPPVVAVKYLEFDVSSKHALGITKTGNYAYHIQTTDADPYICTTAMKENVAQESVMLAFEYKSAAGIPDVQIFFSPVNEKRNVSKLVFSASNTWTKGAFNLKNAIKAFNWGKAGDYLRMDFSSEADKLIEIRNLHFREMNDAEKEEEKAQEEKRNQELRNAEAIEHYLVQDYVAQVTEVTATQTQISVKGLYSGTGNYSLCEVTPWQDVTGTDVFEYRTALTGAPFSLNFDRFVTRNNSTYDRTLSKWLIVKDGAKDEIVSHARYADNIDAKQLLSPGVLAGKKGAAIWTFHPLFQQDLDDLKLTCATYNLLLTELMYATKGYDVITHQYAGKTWYFSRSRIEAIDKVFLEYAKRNVVVAAIVLIQPAAEAADKTIGNLLQHPDYASGHYTMPNLSTPESVETYTAALDFVASRYMRNDNRYGRIHHWIIHNEADIGYEWTNMGSNRAMPVYMNTYVKSMRLCYNIFRQYDSNTEVFGSFTQSWTQPISAEGYPTVKMLNTLNGYCRAEGDFKWGLAIHTYPQSAFEPKTWLDADATFSMNTKMVTFKNLEVVDKWAKTPANKYLGTVKRSVWLSENGTNSPSYSDKDLKEQAAGCAYAWKKLNALSGIDCIVWNNWADNPAEFGLKLGLRNFDFEPKPAWYVYKAADTLEEDAVFNPYKTIIAPYNWNIVDIN